MKSKLPKKLEKIINIVVDIPTIDDINNNLIVGKSCDDRWNAEQSLIETIRVITKNTIYEEETKEIINKCQAIFKTYD